MSYRRPSFIALLVVFFIAPSSSAANDFDPYSMNGGLVSAVAGKDFVVVASDTRLTDGYEILTRKHLQSRLWVASGGTHHHSSLVSNDGSVVIPTDERSSCSNTTPSNTDVTSRTINSISPSSIGQSPTIIASAGCSSDCEALKRQIRSEIDSHVHWNYGMRTLTPTGVANLLGQTLYARRGFPFYSFCIVAGLDDCGGVVHVYDAIGSHERVAVACAGTGKEMLQPILDRMFASISTTTRRPDRGGGAREDEDTILENSEEHGLPKLVRDGKAVHATKQRIGLKLQPPVETCVNCSAEEAVALLVRGYRSVAEREIAVGDDVVLCVIRKGRLINGGEKDGPSTMEVFHYPLKKH
eukprot:CAMPEP_0198260010 /NCGR_PEP_ID=MMETSP1447-20131203/9060_1 /TAXON_ID=420782 /ORGANISM="Chaetoceros dichaeta, Strain CCMP1751" /LENGTH=354 /DNA_ID=CAMNT_0043947549 /DNA_START=95 /DNA_END=1159 /DNA_ORIENTATION=+